ncbi:hypothetical protein [Halobacillus litoralis]|uniref:hypothetical protein n=1 Tax=Halobacillus litoralis TaxID=45668 RepID=UPI001369D16A|nr:hypothetical protein [Halobacillus litoralis]MYL38297.1 hypothetical protein [Halobacillus litoralis]
MKIFLISVCTAAQLTAYGLIIFVSVQAGITALLISYAALALVIARLWKEAKKEKKEEPWNDYRNY